MCRTVSIRFPRLLLATAVLALLFVPPAAGQSLKELWSEYPLYPAELSGSEERTWPPLANGPAPAEVIGGASVEAAPIDAAPAAEALPNNRESLQWLVVAFVAANLALVLLVFFHRTAAVSALSLAPARHAAARIAALAVAVPAERGRRPSSPWHGRGGGRGRPHGSLRSRKRAAPASPPPQAPPARAEVAHLPQPLEEPQPEEEDEDEEEELAPAALRWEMPPPAPPLELEEVRELEYCALEWWRGYVKSQFLARAQRPDGRSYIAGRSPFFRSWHMGEPEESEQAHRARAELILLLRSEGWELREGECDWAWYSACFARKLPESLEHLRERLEREEMS